jgi:hypothetical protein
MKDPMLKLLHVLDQSSAKHMDEGEPEKAKADEKLAQSVSKLAEVLRRIGKKDDESS